MNSFVTVQITGKDVKRFVRFLYQRKIRFYDLEYHPHSVYATLCYADYLVLKEMHTIYEIRVVRYKGWLFIKKVVSTYKIFLLSFLVGLVFLVFLSHVIFSVEVVHDKQEIRDFVQEELEKRGIHKFALGKSFSENEKIVADILKTHRDKLEWMEIEKVGTKYIARVEERKILDLTEETLPRDLIAKKKGILLSISATSGEVVKKVNDYVEAGDVIVSGTIKNKDTIQGYVPAKGKVFAETWYQITVEVPYSYKEVQKTGHKKRVLSLNFLNFEKRFFSSFETKQDEVIFSLKNPLLSISASYIEEEETIEEDVLYSYDMALLKAREIARNKLKAMLSSEDEILYEKSLKNFEEDSKIVVEMFFKVKEDITSYVGISEGSLEEPLE